MHSEDLDRPVEALLDLVAHSTRIGSDLRLVQGAGGNLSAKADGTMWIKASGTRLSQASVEQIYVPMDEAATREAVLRTEQLVPFVRPGGPAGLRPSIETSLHVLLPHPVVFHVHGVGSIAAGLSDGVRDAVAGLPGDLDVTVVPYAKPGVELARAVFAEFQPDLTAQRPLVLVLRNHGLVVGAPDCATASAVLDLVEEHVRSVPAPTPAPAGPCLFPAGTVDADAVWVLCAGALTPDSAVFLGPQPFDQGPAAAVPEDSPSAAHVAPDGSVWVRASLGADEREVAASLVDVARQCRPGAPVSTLSSAQVDELVNWEAETWRRQLKR